MIRRIKTVILISLVFLIALMSDSIYSNQVVIKTVKKGDTVSFFAIKIYGFYNEETAAKIQQANPDIHDLNLIRIGQEIKFPPLFEESDTEKPYSIKTQASNVVVTYLTGKASYKKKSNISWDKLGPNMILFPGDRLKTGNKAFVELVVNNTDVMRLSSNSELFIEELAKTPEEPEAKLKFTVGKVWAKIRSYVERSGKFELEFPTAIAAVQGTIYQANLNADGSATVKVYNGCVEVSEIPSTSKKYYLPPGQLAPPTQVRAPREVSMMKWVKIVREMQQISFGPGMTPGDPESFTEKWLGNWEKFNRERDARFESQ